MIMNETTKQQTERLLIAGYPHIHSRMDGHKVYFDPVPLGRLWQSVHLLDTRYELPTDLNSEQLIEALVRILEAHFNGNGPYKDLAL